MPPLFTLFKHLFGTRGMGGCAGANWVRFDSGGGGTWGKTNWLCSVNPRGSGRLALFRQRRRGTWGEDELALFRQLPGSGELGLFRQRRRRDTGGRQIGFVPSVSGERQIGFVLTADAEGHGRKTNWLCSFNFRRAADWLCSDSGGGGTTRWNFRRPSWQRKLRRSPSQDHTPSGLGIHAG
jgi:hypothetical protein